MRYKKMQIEISSLDLVKTCLFVLWFFKIWANLIIFEFFIVLTKMPTFCVLCSILKTQQYKNGNTKLNFYSPFFLFIHKIFPDKILEAALFFPTSRTPFCCFNRAKKMPQTICYYWKKWTRAVLNAQTAFSLLFSISSIYFCGRLN